MKVEPYALIDVFNTRGELVYSRQRDEAKPERIFKTETAEQMNQMLVGVVESGTGQRAQLDFTHAAGKTGTSSSYRDAWFMGYTGKLITGVWVGRDDYRPVYRSNGKGMTGGSVPAEIWQTYMSVAHKTYDIPTLPGLPDHPRQIEERARLAELRRQNPDFDAAQKAVEDGKLISSATRKVLEKLLAQLDKTTDLPNVAESNDAFVPIRPR